MIIKYALMGLILLVLQWKRGGGFCLGVVCFWMGLFLHLT